MTDALYAKVRRHFDERVLVDLTLVVVAINAVFTDVPVKAIVVTVGTSSDVKKEAFSRVADVLVCGKERLDVNVMLDAFAQRWLRQVRTAPSCCGTCARALSPLLR